MPKKLVTRLFVVAIVAVVGGFALAVGAALAAYAAGVFIMDGPDVGGIELSGFAWAMIILGIVGILAIVSGGACGLVAWIGALLNTAQLEDKTWFVVLLILGVMSAGFIAMLVYVIAGPDSTAGPRDRSDLAAAVG